MKNLTSRLASILHRFARKPVTISKSYAYGFTAEELSNLGI